MNIKIIVLVCSACFIVGSGVGGVVEKEFSKATAAAVVETKNVHCQEQNDTGLNAAMKAQENPGSISTAGAPNVDP